MTLLMVARAQRVLTIKIPFFSPSLETLTSVSLCENVMVHTSLHFLWGLVDFALHWISDCPGKVGYIKGFCGVLSIDTKINE